MVELTEISFRLDSIKDKLKKEFIGLDRVIDQFIHAINPWCTMAESQKRPLVVNLWGMTGVGKTSLVKRFWELWDSEQSIISFNMGSKTNFRDSLDNLQFMINLNGQPAVFIFDEFQHAKTLESGSKEIENPLDRVIWQLMDNGKFVFTKYWPDDGDLKELSMGLQICLERGVKVIGGKVVEGWDTYLNIMGNDESRYKSSKEMEEKNFLSNSDLSSIQEVVKIDYPDKVQLRDYIFQMDGPEILDFVKKVEKSACMSKEMDFSKSLIFVIGNLDEAYEMSNWVSADHDPDILFHESEKITFSTVKEALKGRFRMEEIARLGNIHLIYPALSRKVYQDFIEKELEDVRQRFLDSYRCSLSFSTSIKVMLFEEGVVPTQGFRPLRSSIRYLIESSLVDILQARFYDYDSKLEVDMKGDYLILSYESHELRRKKLHLPVREAKRKKLSPQNMAITAVHEAGHTLVYCILWGRLPKIVTIASSDYNSGGFVEGEFLSDFENLDQLLRDIAVKLAGKKAEEMVFGKENITGGCESDVKTATIRLLNAYRNGTFAQYDAAFESKNKGSGKLLEESSESEKWVMDNLEKAGQLAEELLLLENKKNFKSIIEILLEQKYLSAPALADALYAKDIDVFSLLNSYPSVMNFDRELEHFLKI
jgi:cell division protease FtsH